jgi:hypothetical protein
VTILHTIAFTIGLTEMLPVYAMPRVFVACLMVAAVHLAAWLLAAAVLLLAALVGVG